MIDSSSDLKVLAIVSGKGGTGKSLIAASLGYLLAHCGFRTLLIDMDMFTNGLTFYVLGSYPRKSKTSTRSIFLGEEKFGSLSPIFIPNEFCNDNLYVFPSMPKKKQQSKFTIAQQFADFPSFVRRAKRLIRTAQESGFEYIILDTRGGGDLTSIGSTLAAEAFIIVTEADKISWDIGRQLLGDIDETIEVEELTEELDVSRLGFIINKNVLPPESIVSFLEQEWQCPSLVTIPLDENAVRYFQQNIIPVACDIGTPFCIALLPLVRKLFVSENWDEDNKSRLKILENQAKQAEIITRKKSKYEARTRTIATIMRIYGIFLSTLLLVFLSYSLIVSQKLSERESALLVFIASTLIFIITVSDQDFLEIIKRILTKR